MRLSVIEDRKRENGNVVQTVSSDNVSDGFGWIRPVRKKDPIKRILKMLMAESALFLKQKSIKRKLAAAVNFPHGLLDIGDKFIQDASLALMMRLLKRDSNKINRMLILGCGSGYGEDVQFWLRRTIKNVYGIDVRGNTLWESRIIPDLTQGFGKNIIFKQATAEQIPFESNFFDLVASSAVMEHVRSMEKTVIETHRVLRPGGYAWHSFGPLYYSYGGDHCIDTYGHKHGYDHLLCSENQYRNMINDQNFFKKNAQDPICNYWAVEEQFSYLKPCEYTDLFKKYFKIVDLKAVISPQGLSYRSTCPEKWNQLKEKGLRDIDLLTKGIFVILQKPIDE